MFSSSAALGCSLRPAQLRARSTLPFSVSRIDNVWLCACCCLVQGGHVDAVRALLRGGADPNQRKFDTGGTGEWPAARLSALGWLTWATLFFLRFCSSSLFVGRLSLVFDAALLVASMHGFDDCVRVLLEYGAQVDLGRVSFSPPPHSRPRLVVLTLTHVRHTTRCTAR